MSVRVQLQNQAGAFSLDVDAEWPDRGITALYGPSGAGKTTLLRAMAGLLHAEQGLVRVGTTLWQDSAQRHFLPTFQRGVGYVFQEASLFPHLSVRGNLRYAQKRAPASEQALEFGQVAEWLGIQHMLDRAPAMLSGGERQRVAIARALLSAPRILLLDEPLSALDEKSREEIFPCLEHLHGALQIPVLLVTHLLREVARLADHVVRMDAGRVVEAGPAAEILPRMLPVDEKERGPVSLLRGSVQRLDEAYGLSGVDTDFGLFWLPARLARASVAAFQVQARDISLGRYPHQDTTILNQFPAHIEEVCSVGEAQVLVRLRPRAPASPARLAALITRRSSDALGLAVGQEVWVRVKGVSLLE